MCMSKYSTTHTDDSEGHYHADDADDVVDAGEPEPTIYLHDPDSESEIDQLHNSDDELVPAVPNHIPPPNLSNQPPPLPTEVIDPLSVFNSIPLDQRMQLHDQLMAQLHAQPSPSATTTRTSPPARRPKLPQRKKPPRAARRND
jgi:hypothetical protein